MQELINVRERQRFLSSDIMDMQESIRSTFDKLVRGAIGPGGYYDGLQADDTGQWEVTLLPGNLFIGGAMYRKDANTVFSDTLYNMRPLAQKKIVAIIGYGQDIESTASGSPAEPRQFIVNTTTRETEVQQVSTRLVRFAKIDIIGGVEQAQPAAPTPGAGNILIATVLLGTSGIEAVTMNAAALLPQVERNSVAIGVLADFLDVLGLRVATLISDNATLKNEVSNLATKDELNRIHALAEDAFQTAKRALAIAQNLDTGATYLRDFEDRFVDELYSDPSGAGYSVLVKNGLNFKAGTSATLTNGIETFNVVEPKVIINNDLMLPAYTNRLVVDAFGQGKISRQAAIQAFTSSTHAAHTTRPPKVEVNYTTRNSQITSKTKATGASMTISGVTVGSTPVNLPVTAASVAAAKKEIAFLSGSSAMPEFTVTGVTAKILLELGGVYALHTTIKFSFVKKTTDTKHYETDTVTTVDGQGRGETWLQDRDGWLTQVGIFVTQKGSTGDIRLMVSEVDASGAPDLTQSPVMVTVPFASILASPMTTVSPVGIETIVSVPPVMCYGGRRYALAVISTGAHVLRMTEGVSTVTQGEHWALSDANKWERPALETKQTLAFRLYFARFASTRVEVDLKPLSLAGGIQDVSVESRGVVPALTALSFEVQPDGGAWRVLGPTSGQRVQADLSSNPELMPFRVVFEGTLDVMPALSRGATKSTVKVSKAALAFTHWSQIITTPAPANTIKVMHRLRNFDETPHNFTVTLVTDPGGTPTTETADAVVDDVLPDGSTLRTSSFVIPVAKSTFQIKEVAAATAVSALFSAEQVYATFSDV